MRDASGQSSVELVGLVPLLLTVGLAVSALLSAGAAEHAAGGAAEAGAVALLQGRHRLPPRASGRPTNRRQLSDERSHRAHDVRRCRPAAGA